MYEALQVIAEIAGKNLIVTEPVHGEVTLRLKNVPWDQALDILLETHGLKLVNRTDTLIIAPFSATTAQIEDELGLTYGELDQLAPSDIDGGTPQTQQTRLNGLLAVYARKEKEHSIVEQNLKTSREQNRGAATTAGNPPGEERRATARTLDFETQAPGK